MRWIFPLLILAPAYAKTADFWQINVPLATNSTQEIQQALPKALETVLVRVSGTSPIDSPEPMNVKTAKNAIQHYHLSSTPCVDSESSCTMLHVQFKKEAVAQLLQSLHLSEWTGTRASSFINITVDDGIQSITIDDTHPMHKILQQTADNRGIDIALPNDSPHQQNIHHTEQTLVTKLTLQEEELWQINWQLYTQTELFEWSSSANNLPDALRVSIDSLADFMHQQDQSPNETIVETSSTLIINHIPNFIGQEKTLKTLRTHPQVQNVNIVEQNHDRVKIQIHHTLPLEKILATIPNLRIEDPLESESEEIITTWHTNDAPSPF